MNCIKKGFTLIEILIVVILVAVLCGAAYPAFRQYRAQEAQTVMIDDGRRIGAAAQTYFAESMSRQLVLGYNKQTGKIMGPESFEMLDGNQIAPGYDLPKEFTVTMNNKAAFKLIHPLGGVYTFDDKGELSKTAE